MSFSRRTFVSRCTAALGVFSLRPALSAWGEPQAATPKALLPRPSVADYDKLVKLSANENPYGPSEVVVKAMTDGLKYANRYGAPDGGLVEAIAAHHGVKPENVLVGAGSSEILDVVGTTYLEGGRRVLGFDPTYNSVYQHATTVKSEGIKLPLRPDSTQDIGALVQAARIHYRDIGLVYLCNPNNPTGIVVRRDEVKQLLDGLPADVPVLIDEAYHHFVTDPGYATAIPYVLEGRQVVVSRTFSKIAGLAGMRLGYAIAPKEMIEHMRPHAMGSINTAVRWAGVAALADTETQTRVPTQNAASRKHTPAAPEALRYHGLPS